MNSFVHQCVIKVCILGLSLSVIFEPFSQSCCVILERIGKDPKDIKKYYNSSVFGPSSCETLIPYALVIGENS